MATLSGKYTIGDPIEYTSIYGYAKRMFPVRQGDEKIGNVKEETVLNGDGSEASKSFYTRNIVRPRGAKRFYASVEDLIIAFGGQIDRVVANTVANTVAKSPLALKRAANKAAKLATEEALSAQLAEKKANRKALKLAAVKAADRAAVKEIGPKSPVKSRVQKFS